MNLLHAVRTEPLSDDSALRGVKPDYADAFAITLRDNDWRSAEAMFRSAIGPTARVGGTLVYWAHRHLLRFELGQYANGQHMMGWRIAHSTESVVTLSATGPLMDGVLSLRCWDRVAVLSTYLVYRNEAAAVVWRAVGPVHRTLAPRLLENCVRRHPIRV
jgi:hypothetical protein